jgi:ferritin-like metal-binding protein YciE
MKAHETHNNLIDLLQDAWSFESKLLELVEEQVRSCQHGHSRRLYAEHARMTRAQRARIQQRLEELGTAPLCQAGWFTARLRRLSLEVEAHDSWHDQDTQLLITSYGIKQVECGMYKALIRQAHQQADKPTAALGRVSLEEEEATARRLLYCIGLATRSRAA